MRKGEGGKKRKSNTDSKTWDSEKMTEPGEPSQTKKQIAKDRNERDKPSKGSTKSLSKKQLHAQIKALQAQAEANTSPNEPTLEEQIGRAHV